MLWPVWKSDVIFRFSQGYLKEPPDMTVDFADNSAVPWGNKSFCLNDFAATLCLRGLSVWEARNQEIALRYLQQ